jgi:hypothetical protein
LIAHQRTRVPRDERKDSSEEVLILGRNPKIQKQKRTLFVALEKSQQAQMNLNTSYSEQKAKIAQLQIQNESMKRWSCRSRRTNPQRKTRTKTGQEEPHSETWGGDPSLVKKNGQVK